jgi:hypothetical protein
MRGPFAMILVFFAWMDSSSTSAQDKLDRDQLLFFRTDAGKIEPVKTLADWQKRRASIVATMQSIMGPLADPDTAHEFPPEMRKQAYRLLDLVFKK